ncbi:MAG: autotransporter-associated beta strand repeat-containing protein, partial [Opitutales bacterium]|nr:autotransporter-associated beta strand repeat-containing protein [Opitutales bacterium]
MAKAGQLTISVGAPDAASFTVQAIEPSSVLRLSSGYFVENDLTADSLETVRSGEYTESDLLYRKSRWAQQQGADNARGIQITEQQTLFYGKVLVEGGVTLHLGSETSSESVFSGASSIELIGSDYPDAGQWEASVLMITGTQLVRNLKGANGSSAVRISEGGTLVLTNTDNSYAGGFAGEGNLVKLGKSNQIISSNKYGELVGSLSVLSGSVSVNQGESSVGTSGLVLKAGTSATLASDARVGALVGEAMSAVSVNGSLTVGGNSKPSGASDGSYFATSDYGAYDNLFSGTGVAAVQQNLRTAAENARLYQPGSAISSVPVTTDDTLTYLKNPAKLAYKTDSNVLDGAFASLFTSTGIDQHGNDVFAKMKEDFYGNIVFGDAATIADWLRKEFTTEKIINFISNDGSALSASQKQSLTVLAQTITERSDGVRGYLDSQGNLNTNGWNAIVAAGGLEYLKSTYDWFLVGMADDSLYSFITEFYSDYEFVLTQDVATQIGQIYGVDSSAWVSGNTANYGKFVESFGVSSSEFAGTLSGTGSLIKTGAETLKLTGQNSYTGTTLVKSGELFVDWNAIQRTVGISVDEGALLTISGTDADIRDAYTDPETGKDTGYETNKGYGSLFSGNNADYARLSGRGTVLKLGNGKVDLGKALSDVSENASDFTGSFLVANGTLKAEVDSVARTVAQTPLAFNIYFSKDTETAENPVATPSFELSFVRTGGFGYIVGTQPSVLDFTGVIDGEGTFVLDAGVSRPNSDVASVNNILTVASEKISVSTVDIKSGTLNLAVSGNGTQSWFKTVNLGEKTALRFDLNADAALTDTAIVGSNGSLIVSSSETNINDIYVPKTLTVTNGSLAGVSSLELSGGATLVLNGTAAATSGDDVVLTSLNAEAQTVLNIGADRTVALEGSGTIAGTLVGSGKFIFNGDKDSTLTLGNTDYVRETTAFGGEIEFNGGTIVFAAGEAQTVSYDGLKISGSAVGLEGRTIVKDGAGTVKILRDGSTTNSISVTDLAIDVRTGELAVSGDMFAENGGTLPKSVSIADGAKFTFCENFAGTNFDLGNLGEISGTGTLAFDLTTATTVNVSEFNAADFSGVVSLSANTTLALGAKVTEFAAFSGEGVVTVEAQNLTVRVDGNADGAEKFVGTISGANLQSLTVVGDGALVFGSSTSIPVSTIYVGTVNENGGVGVSSDWNGKVIAVGAFSSVLIDGDSKFSGTGTSVEVQESVKSLSLSCSGTLDLGVAAVATAFKLKNVDGDAIVLDGSLDVTLSNVAGSALTLRNLGELNAEVFNLKTNVGGGLVFDGTPVAGSYSLRALPATPQTVWVRDISGAGDVTVTNGANLKLAAGTLSYTGATVVSGNSALEYAAGTVSQSSSLT